MAAAVDTAYIAASYSLPEPTIQTLLDAPTQELVQTLLEQLEAKARDYDNVKAEKLRADVELETATRNGEIRAKALKSSLDQRLSEIEELRKQVNEKENARQSLETELNDLKSSSTTSTSEVQTLQSRIATLESSNRDTLALLEAKSTSHDKLTEELSAQHQKTVALRKEVSELEEKNQTLQNASLTTKFREQNQQQEIDLLKKNVEWHETELKTRGSEYSKFRKEKSAKIAELQRTNEDLTQTIDSLRRTEATLKTRVEELTQQVQESLERVHNLQEEAQRVEESHRGDQENINRLAELQKQRADTAQARLREVQSSFDNIREQAANEIGQLQAEVETEKTQRAASDDKVAALELQIEELENAAAGAQARSIPATPRRGMNGFGTPNRLQGTPGGFTPGASRGKGSLTITQLYTENAELKAQVAAAVRRNNQLNETLDSFVRDVDTFQPEFDELKVSEARYKQELSEMSEVLEVERKDREAAVKESRKSQGKVDGLTREAQILRQQLRDLSTQLRYVFVEMQAKEDGLERLSEDDRRLFHRLAQNPIDESSLEGMTDIQRFISQRLVIFKTVAGLQEKNEELLKIVRELGDRIEGEEATNKKRHEEEVKQELETLRDVKVKTEDEIKSLTIRNQSYMKERDMYRRMLTHRGLLEPGADLQAQFGQSVDARANTSPARTEAMDVDQPAHGRDLADYAKLLKDMQSHFDAYKEEAASSQSSLKQQVDTLAKEKAALQGDNARNTSRLTLATDRLELMNSNYATLKKENEELQKRAQTLMDNAARQELKTQQAAEELVEHKGLTDSMRNEMANLKAEKELWKSIQTRLQEDNQALTDEKAKLNKLVNDLQNLQNEREHAESENRRRLQNRIDSLDSELTTVKRKLDEETEESKKAALRREYESDQNRTRIDDLVKSLSTIREELVSVKTQRDQLQARVDELKIELRAAEQRAQDLQPRPSTRPTAATDTEMVDNDALTREQELSVQITDLKRDLELAQAELESSRGHVENYKSIAQASEEELNSLNETTEQYREETDRLLSDKDAKIVDLEKRVEEIALELTNANNELNELRSVTEEAEQKFNEQKANFDIEIARLKDESERYQETAKLHQEDLKAQAEIAQQAQQSYENELVKHADAARALQKVRGEHNELKTEVAGIKAEAESAKTSLAQSEESWAESRDRYEREITDLKSRREEVNDQNRILHQQLDSVTAQITALKQSRNITDTDGEGESADQGNGIADLQEVIRYLRREKEIVDVQYELSIQEAKRLKQQLDHTQSQLDATREKLSQERQVQMDKEQNAISHSKLMETINELNVFRESSTTLRNEARQAQSQLADKVKEVESLYARIQPLEAKVQELESENEAKTGNIELLEKLRNELQQRNQNILSKYNRIDPVEHESLKTQIETLTTERDEALAAKVPLEEQLATANATVESAETKRLKTIEAAKAKNRENQNSMKALREEIDSVKAELENVKAELETTKTARDEALARAEQQQHDAEMRDATESGEVMEGALAYEEMAREATARAEAAEAKALSAESRASEEAVKLAAAHAQLESLQGRIAELEAQVTSLQQQLETSKQEHGQTQSTETTVDDDGSRPAEIEQLKAELTQVKAELISVKQDNESLHATALAPERGEGAQAAGDQNVDEQVNERLQARLAELDAEYNEKFAQAEAQAQAKADETLRNRSQQVKNKANAMMKEKNDQMAKEREDFEARIAQLTEEKDAEIARLKSEHEAALLQGSTSSTTAPVKDETTSVAPAEMKGAADGNNPTLPRSELLQSLTDEEKVDVADSMPPLKVRDFINKSEVAKSIIRQNIEKKVTVERNQWESKLAAEKEALLQTHAIEMAEKVKVAKEQAANSFNMKDKLMKNMRDTQKAKLDKVASLAVESPTMPVSEAWDIVKVVKAEAAKPPIPAAQTAPATAPATPAVNGQAQTPAVVPTAPAGTVQPSPVAATPAPGQPRQGAFTPATQPLPSNPFANAGAIPTGGAFGQPSTGIRAPSFGAPGGAFGQPSVLPGVQGQQFVQPNQIGNMRGGMARGRGGIGRGGPQFQQGQQAQGQAQQPQAQSQGAPGQATGIPRGGGIPRGRGRGGRGGTPSQAGSQASSTSDPASLNPGAQGFVPRGGGAQKRARGDDSTADGAGGKRAKSGEA